MLRDILRFHLRAQVGIADGLPNMTTSIIIIGGGCIFKVQLLKGDFDGVGHIRTFNFMDSVPERKYVKQKESRVLYAPKSVII